MRGLANGMIVVNQGLLGIMDDDELALVLGHELVHATHEHTAGKNERYLAPRPLFDAGGVATARQPVDGPRRGPEAQSV